MFPANTWLFDTEIRHAIPDKAVPNRLGYRYCNHWGDHAGMGLSCVVVSRPDGSGMQYFTSLTSTEVLRFSAPTLRCQPLNELRYLLEQADLVVGYGSRLFDAKLLASVDIYIPPRKHLDFLYEIKKKLRNQAPKGYKLNDVSLRCGGPAKTGDGAYAPFLWQDGEFDKVLTYCGNDVQMLAAITQRYLLTEGCIPDVNHNPLKLRLPEHIAVEDL